MSGELPWVVTTGFNKDGEDTIACTRCGAAPSVIRHEGSEAVFGMFRRDFEAGHVNCQPKDEVA